MLAINLPQFRVKNTQQAHQLLRVYIWLIPQAANYRPLDGVASHTDITVHHSPVRVMAESGASKTYPVRAGELKKG